MMATVTKYHTNITKLIINILKLQKNYLSFVVLRASSFQGKCSIRNKCIRQTISWEKRKIFLKWKAVYFVGENRE